MNMDQPKKTEALLKDLSRAKDYLEKIGSSQPPFRNGELGKLHTVEIKTTIHHQAGAGDTNYHNNSAFDKYLALVVSRNFDTLSAKAIELMINDYEDSLITEEEFLRERLARIEKLKAGHEVQP